MFELRTSFDGARHLVDMHVLLSEPDSKGRSMAISVKTKVDEDNVTWDDDLSFARESARFMRDQLQELNGKGGVQCRNKSSSTSSFRSLLGTHRSSTRESDPTDLWANALKEHLADKTKKTEDKLAGLRRQMHSFRGSDRKRAALTAAVEDTGARRDRLLNHRFAVVTIFCGSHEEAHFSTLPDDKLCELSGSAA